MLRRQQILWICSAATIAVGISLIITGAVLTIIPLIIVGFATVLSASIGIMCASIDSRSS
jgi:hypothetical protein